MAGSLSFPNEIKDVYTKLVFFDTNTNTFKRDNGTSDADLSSYMGHSGIAKDVDYFKFTTSSTVASGNILEIINNTVTRFSIDHKGVVGLYNQTTTPVAVEGGLYYKDDNLYLGVSSVE